jgi:gas vesicle protein
MTHATTTNNAGLSALAFLAGIGIGTAAALLLAPRSGQEMRSHIKEKTLDARDKMLEKANERKNMVANKVEDVMDSAAAKLETGKEVADNAKKRARKAEATNVDEIEIR